MGLFRHPAQEGSPHGPPTNGSALERIIPLDSVQGYKEEVSWNNRNVLNLGTIEVSADKGVSIGWFEGLAPGMILGWTALGFLAILGGRAGKTGPRRSPPRAPAGRLHASRPGPLTRGRALFF